MSDVAITTANSAHEALRRQRAARAIEVWIDSAWELACHADEQQAWDWLAGQILAAIDRPDMPLVLADDGDAA